MITVERDVHYVLAAMGGKETVSATKVFKEITAIATKTDNTFIAETTDKLVKEVSRNIDVSCLLERAKIVSSGKQKITMSDMVIAAMLESGVDDATVVKFATRAGTILRPIHTPIPGNILPRSLESVIEGRENEIAKLAMLMNKKTRVIAIIGDRGIGKRTIVEGVAKAIAANRFPTLNKVIIDMDTVIGIADEVAKEINATAREPGQQPQWMPYGMFDTNTVYGLIDHERFARAIRLDELIPQLVDRGANLIICTTPKFVNQLQKNPNLTHHIEILEIEEMEKKRAISAINVAKTKIENDYFCHIPDSIVEFTYNLSARFPMEYAQPGRTLGVLELTAASKRLGDTEKLSSLLRTDFEELIKTNKLREAKQYLSANEEFLLSRLKVGRMPIEQSDISKLLCSQLGISGNVPPEAVTADNIKQLSLLETHVRKYVYGQNTAIKNICDAIRRKAIRISTDRSPPSFLLVGATGTGKTLTAKKIAELMFGTEKAIIRIDMSEYGERHTVSRLIGAPPGYVGYEDGGQLTDRVAKRPHSVILLDEIEKAHKDVLNVLLQILDDGLLTDGKGKTVRFNDAIIFLTSNLGTKDQVGKIGFGESGVKVSEDSVMTAVSSFLPPELRNRLSKIIMYESLGDNEVAGIIDYEISLATKNVAFKINVDKAAKDYVMKMTKEKGNVAEYNGREVKRIVQQYLFTPITDRIIEFGATPTVISVTAKDELIIAVE